MVAGTALSNIFTRTEDRQFLATPGNGVMVPTDSFFFRPCIIAESHFGHERGHENGNHCWTENANSLPNLYQNPKNLKPET